MSNGIQSAEQFKVVRIIMDSEKFSRPLVLAGSDRQTTVVVEFNVYENITSPFLTADMILQDDQDIYRVANLSGTERVTFEFTTPLDDDQIISKTFVITSIDQSIKSNDYTNLLSFKLIEDIGFYDRVNRFSKSYEGKGEQIIQKIATDVFQKDVDVVNSKESFQKAFRYIVPNQSALESIRSVMYKMTTEFGMPYFFFSTLAGDNFVLTDLESIIASNAFNERKPFTYSQAVTNADVNDLAGKAVNISNFEGYNLEDSLMLSQKGAIGASYKNINVTSGEIYKSHVDMIARFQTLLDNDLIPRNYKQLLVDTLFVADPTNKDTRRLQDFNTQHFSEISSDPYPFDPGINAFGQEDYQSFNALRLIRNNFLHHLLKNIYRVYVPGLLFSYKNPKTTVGNQIDINVFRNQILQPGMGLERAVDQSRSGKFIILAKRHIFNIVSDTHNVSLEVGRISNLENTE